jgi:hypothetical protein
MNGEGDFLHRPSGVTGHVIDWFGVVTDWSVDNENEPHRVGRQGSEGAHVEMHSLLGTGDAEGMGARASAVWHRIIGLQVAIAC